MRSFFSHIIVAAIAVAAVGGYFHWNEILTQVGSRVCSYEILGRFGASQPVVLGEASEKSKSGSDQPEKPEQQGSVEKSSEVGKINRVAAVSVNVSSDKSMESAWLEARRSYWAGEADAEKSYLALIERFPEQADLRGELGNIYIKSGRREQAASQFYSAGLSLIKSNQKEKAVKVINLLDDLDPAKSAMLKQALDAAG